MQSARTLLLILIVVSLLFQSVGASFLYAATSQSDGVAMEHHAAISPMVHDMDNHHESPLAEASESCHSNSIFLCGDCICHTLSSLNLSFELAPQEVHNSHLAQLRGVQPRIFASVNPRPPQFS